MGLSLLPPRPGDPHRQVQAPADISSFPHAHTGTIRASNRAFLRICRGLIMEVANADETAGITAELDALTEADRPVHDP